MAEIHTPVQPVTGEASSSSSSPPPARTKPATPPLSKRPPSIHQIYALPAPIRTFPLPTFYPNNPISLFHVAYAWLGQVLTPPLAEPSVVHHGIWSDTTISVHIVDEKSMRALWEQGFYGKGSLSRSEPNWLKREQVRRGLQEGHVSEIFTVQRREERAQAKWERARLEQEAIRQTKLEEAQRAAAIVAPIPKPAKTDEPPLGTKFSQELEDTEGIGSIVLVAPVGPVELLSLPNSTADLAALLETVDASRAEAADGRVNGINSSGAAATTPAPAPATTARTDTEMPDLAIVDGPQSDDQAEPQTPDESVDEAVRGKPPKSPLSRSSSSDFDETKSLKRRKSVRFSPTVESTTFNFADPPSPKRSGVVKTSSPMAGGHDILADAKSESRCPPAAAQASGPAATRSDPIINKEHLQLMPEEVFFLSFGLGVLDVTNPATGRSLSPRELFTLFRQYSYFPPRNGPDELEPEPDDGFLVNYAVYHHFRSLGWVPRAGIKFGVDWLLYTRGPVFDHAEFGLIVIPSYSDPGWKRAGKKRRPQKTWAWLHSVVRVLSHVTKSLVLVYVDVPPPQKFDAALEGGITEALRLYRIREVMVKRWSSNRNR
ncbi:putative tRNA-splicing endonuclease subunit tsp-2 [Escovopsis weberi]|uniref:tRNA-intron lyase n=1 Tax=Escovopsis weberi TaxID=150374 RepID=A0A0M8MUJ0_ESCWE|nr:putative tRNA-splicing endonuclease subunit tsp-2 [Escovopsis weberi]